VASPLDRLRPAARAARGAARSARFAMWARRLSVEMRRNEGRLILDAPHGADFDAPPHVRVLWEGDGDRTFTLRIGRDVRFGRGVTLIVWAHGTNVLEIGDGAQVDDQAHLHLRGGTIRIDRAAIVRDFTVLRSEGLLAVGERGNVSHGSVIHCKERVEIHDYVGLAEHVTVVDSDHSFGPGDDYFLDRPVSITPVEIGRNSFVAAKAVVTRGARIGRNSVVAAGAVVVAGDYDDNVLLAGSPAKQVKTFT
jgi:acetyltransferase-like isoleucine patch superfamily enzyme